MPKLLSPIIFSFCACMVVYGQQAKVTGIVKNRKEEPVPYANIVINNTVSDEPSIITYGYTDEQGRFSLEIPRDIPSISLNVTAIGYQETTIPKKLHENLQFTIYLEEKVTQLEEVVVKAKTNEDVLDLEIATMNLSKEKTLRDVLDKTEGVIIGEEGAISYQGKQINKILINRKEVFINQNKVALDNLDYEIMDKVQIIDNYKDKFSIDFDRIRDPVINIDTKSEFKGILKAELNAGYGFKDKYSFLGKGFFFSDKFNAFITTHTNNTGEKELSQNDVLSSVTKYATASLNNTLQPFFIDDNQTRKNFVSNGSLTFRWQGDKSKTGIVVYHGNIHTEREVNYRTFAADTMIEKSRSQNTRKGNFISATANYSHFISSNTVLQNKLSTVLVDQKRTGISMDTLFVPDRTYLMEQNRNSPKNFAISNVLELTHLLGDRVAFDLDLDYYYGIFSRDYEARLLNINASDIFQEERSSKRYLLARGNFKFKLDKAALNTGVVFTNNIESGSLEYRKNSNGDTDLKRNIATVGVPLYLSGSMKKLDYRLSMTPTLIIRDRDDNQNFLRMVHNLTYNFETQNKLGLGISHDYRFYGLNSLYDTIVKSYNHKVINTNSDNLEKFSIKDELAVSWFNNNVARSKSMHIIYRYNRERDFLQSVLDSISDNMFFYSNRIFDKKQTHTLNTGGKKGFYLGNAYHRLNVGGDLNLSHSRYTTAVNNKVALAEVSSWKPGIEITFAPRKFFMTETGNRFEWNQLFFDLDGNETNRQSVFTNTFSAEGFGDKINWNFDFIYRIYNINADTFDVPDVNLNFQYDVSEKLSFSIKGQSLLTLFKLNNYNFVNTISDGNTVTQIATDNNLGYLLFYTTFNF
ncbi:carboxypeptidase-like regulatory domain-containing protein [Sinomicrobium kalidii]|uniref:carboxypeptidase-like regulatory domain-containing protein n=1 Tax=Sinomicrobium kalidii TaxID=2900738 RepID=UPI001E2978B6|nr:carboxypeptidase-like regulatory domain-containing protein [Sinomicrobium kalidii]UGU16865.1 carboxypeptidase-like regulatory domain-containing protein [Sinomicrobium kalidii]